MRIIAVILGILTVLLVGAYVVAFTQIGNDMVKPYIEDIASEKLQKDVKIEKFTLTMSHLSLQAEVPNEAALAVDGDIKILDQWFDLLYHVQAQNLKTPAMTIREKMEVSGNAKGFIDDFIAKGKGKAFASNIDFDVHLVEKNPLDGTINAKGISTASVLELLGKPAYANGLVDVVAKVKNSNGNLAGNADILIHNSKINSTFVKRDFDIELPKDLTYVGKINGVVKGDTLNAKSEIVSSVATLKTSKTDVNLKSMDIKSDYDVKINDLKKLVFITKKELFGALHVDGNIIKSGKNLFVNAKSDIFDGNFNATLENNSLKANAKNLQIKKILSMLGEPAMAYGIVNMDANIDDISKKDKTAIMNLHVNSGELVGTHMRSKFDLDFPPVTNFSGSVAAELEGENLQANTDIKSTLANIKATKSLFNLTSQDFSSDFDIDIDNLAPIGKIAKQELRGKFSINGDASMKNKQLSFNVHTDSLGGKIDANMKDNQLDASLKDVSVEKILYMLKQPMFAKGSMNANAKFSSLSLPNLNGTFNYTLNNGLLLGDGLRELAKNDINYPKSSPFAIKSDIKVNDGFANFTNSINSDLASIPSFKGTYDINKKILDSEYNIDIKELSKLAFLTKQVLHGKLQAKGVVQMNKDNLRATANAPILGGQSKSEYNKNILTSKATTISVKGLSELLDLPYVFDSTGDFDLKYNTTSKKGNYSLLMRQGHMVKTKLSTLVQTFTNYDMTSEVYKDTTLKGSINDTKVTYVLDMNGTQTKLSIPNGVYDMKTKQTKANFNLNFQKTDLEGTISGEASSPKIKISGSKYLKNKAIKELDKHIPEKQKGIVKDLLKLF